MPVPRIRSSQPPAAGGPAAAVPTAAAGSSGHAHIVGSGAPTSAVELSLLRPYRLGKELGRGGFGVVFEALHSQTGESVAIKRISLANVGPAELADIQGEIELLKQLSHQNIVRYVDSIRTHDFLYIVLELVENGSLAAAIKRFGNFDEQLTAVYVAQVLRGLAYLHDNGVIHRDIKGANILVTKDGVVKLTDFGTAVHEADRGGAESIAGSPFWMAPEVIELAGATPASDIWSVGATVLELVSGRPPFFDLPPMAALFHIVQDETVPLPDGLSPALREFLSECFRKEPSFRKTAAALLEHPWIVTNVRVSSKARQAAAAAASAGRASLGGAASGARWAIGTSASSSSGSRRAPPADQPVSSEADPVAIPELGPPGGRARRLAAAASHGDPEPIVTGGGSLDLLDWDADAVEREGGGGIGPPSTAADFAALSDATIVTTQRLLQLGSVGFGGGKALPATQAARGRGAPTAAGEAKSTVDTDADDDWDADDAATGAQAVERASRPAVTARAPAGASLAALSEDDDDWDAAPAPAMTVAPRVGVSVRPAAPARAAAAAAARAPPPRLLAALDARAVASAFGEDDDGASPAPASQQLRANRAVIKGTAAAAAPQGGRPAPLGAYVDADDDDAALSAIGTRLTMARPTERGGRPGAARGTVLPRAASALKAADEQPSTRTQAAAEASSSWENAVQRPLVAATGGMGFADLRARLAAKRSGGPTAGSFRGASDLPLHSPSTSDAAADPFAQFDEADFSADPRAEALRNAQRELARLAARLEPSCALDSPASVRPVCRALIARFSAEPQLRAFFVRSHGVLPLLELLQACGDRPFVVAWLLRLLNALASGDESVQESLALIGALPVVLPFAGAAHPAPLRAQAAALVHELTHSSPEALRTLVACGGLRAIASLLQPSARPAVLDPALVLPSSLPPLPPRLTCDAEDGGGADDDPVAAAAAAGTTAARIASHAEEGLRALLGDWRRPGDASFTAVFGGGGDGPPPATALDDWLLVEGDDVAASAAEAAEEASASGTAGSPGIPLDVLAEHWMLAEMRLCGTALRGVQAVLSPQAYTRSGTMTPNEFRRLFVKVGLLPALSASLRTVFLYLCAQLSSAVAAALPANALATPASEPPPVVAIPAGGPVAAGVATPLSSVVAAAAAAGVPVQSLVLQREPGASPLTSASGATSNRSRSGSGSGFASGPAASFPPPPDNAVLPALAGYAKQQQQQQRVRLPVDARLARSAGALPPVLPPVVRRPLQVAALLPLHVEPPSTEHPADDDEEEDDDFMPLRQSQSQAQSEEAKATDERVALAGEASAAPATGDDGTAIAMPSSTDASIAAINAAVSARPAVAAALGNLALMTDLLSVFAQGDATVKVAVASPPAVAALLRMLRPAPFALLHQPVYSHAVLGALKALRFMSMDPQALEVLHTVGAVATLVPFLVRETGLRGGAAGGSSAAATGLARSAGGAAPPPPPLRSGHAPSLSGGDVALSGGAGGRRPPHSGTGRVGSAAVIAATRAVSAHSYTAPGAPTFQQQQQLLLLHTPAGSLHADRPAAAAYSSKEVQSHVLHTLFNLCRVSKARQAAAALAGIIPPLQAVVASGGILKPLAVPILCDLAHAGSRTRTLLWEADGVAGYVGMLGLDYWHTHALNALAAWAALDATRVQSVLLRPESLAAVTRLLASSAAYLEQILPGLAGLLDKCPAVAADLAASDDFVGELVRRLGAPVASPTSLRHLLSLLRSAFNASRARGDLVQRWALGPLLTGVVGRVGDRALLLRMVLDLLRDFRATEGPPPVVAG